jgi:hypothetical protein
MVDLVTFFAASKDSAVRILVVIRKSNNNNEKISSHYKTWLKLKLPSCGYFGIEKEILGGNGT